MASRASSLVLRSALSVNGRWCLAQSRWLSTGACHQATNRSTYIKGGSNPTGITPEIRDLVKNQRTAENMADWNVQPGIGAPIRFDYRDPEDIDDDQTADLVYWPRKGEKLDPNYKPSPLLLVKRVKKVGGQPYYHKETLQQLGLGRHHPDDRVIVVPNIPSMCYKLYTVKHMIEVIPLKFPMGYPENEADFDPKCCRINHKGEFYYHKELKIPIEEIAAPADSKAKITPAHIEKEARKHWEWSWQSPLGNANYHRDSGFQHPELKDFKDDPKFIARQKFTDVPHKETHQTKFWTRGNRGKVKKNPDRY